MIRWEAVIVALIGALVGLVLGVFLGVCVSASPSSRPRAIPWGSMIVFLSASVSSGCSRRTPPGPPAARLNILEAIQNE